MGGKKKCYKCDKEATGQEHIPPKCIFPERKDLDGDYRKNLITVPSCDEHNLQKSKDDEFLMAFVSGYIMNNAIGYLHTKTKLKRTLDKIHDGFIEKVIKGAKAVNSKTKDGFEFPLLSGQPNIERLSKCIEQIACGLFFHEYQNPFRGQVRIIYGFLEYQDENVNKMKSYLKDVFDGSTIEFPRKGANQKVFYYQLIPPNNLGLISIRITFFEGTHFFIALLPEGSPEPFDLGMKMIQDGSKTTIKFKGKDYEFN